MSQSTPSKRRPLIVANWKMNKNSSETESFIKDFSAKIPANFDRDVAVCPPFTSLGTASSLLQSVSAAGKKIFLGAQNMNENKSGAFTGEISPSMLKAVGCEYVILGHSERRQIFGETDAIINKKILAAFQNGLLPIVCVGETLEERETNKTMAVISKQLEGALANLPSAETQKITVAYEPVWAIGTGKNATPEQAQEVHLFIRDRLKDQYGSQTSLVVRILYGGSVKPDNMGTLMACEDIDGGLVGGASLEAQSFFDIANFKTKALIH